MSCSAGATMMPSAADVTEPIDVLVLCHLAKELGAICAHAGKDVLDVFDVDHRDPQTAAASVEAHLYRFARRADAHGCCAGPEASAGATISYSIGPGGA